MTTTTKAKAASDAVLAYGLDMLDQAQARLEAAGVLRVYGVDWLARDELGEGELYGGTRIVGLYYKDWKTWHPAEKPHGTKLEEALETALDPATYATDADDLGLARFALDAAMFEHNRRFSDGETDELYWSYETPHDGATA